MSRFTSIGSTLKPTRFQASAHLVPEMRLISRSADQPPIKTATVMFFGDGICVLTQPVTSSFSCNFVIITYFVIAGPDPAIQS